MTRYFPNFSRPRCWLIERNKKKKKKKKKKRLEQEIVITVPV